MNDVNVYSYLWGLLLKTCFMKPVSSFTALSLLFIWAQTFLVLH